MERISFKIWVFLGLLLFPFSSFSDNGTLKHNKNEPSVVNGRGAALDLCTKEFFRDIHKQYYNYFKLYREKEEGNVTWIFSLIPTYQGYNSPEKLLSELRECKVKNGEIVYFTKTNLDKDSVLKRNAYFQGEERGYTPLMHAVIESDEDEVNRLIKQGADINIRPRSYEQRNSYYILEMVASDKLDSIGIMLLKAGANVNEVLPNGSPLTFKSVSELDDVRLEWLLKHGADANAVNGQGDSLLLFTIKTRPYEKTIKLLVKYGADANRINNTGESVASLVQGNVYMFDLLHKDRSRVGVDTNGVDTHPDTVTINSGVIPEYSKQFIQSEDFYTHAIGTLEKDGVQGHYGFVKASDSDTPVFYMFFDNKSNSWANVGFNITKGPLSREKDLSDYHSLFEPLGRNAHKTVLSTSYVNIYRYEGHTDSINSGEIYTISFSVEKLKPVLQMYLDMKQEGSLVDKQYIKSNKLTVKERDKLINDLALYNRVGFSFDKLTKHACGDEVVPYLDSYKYQDDTIFIYSASCISDIGGEGTLDGKELLKLFRLNGEEVVEVLSILEKGGSNTHLPSYFLINDNLRMMDLDNDGNIEVVLNPIEGLGSGQYLYEIVDGHLVKLLTEDVWSEGEAYSASECSIGEPFQNCGSW